MIIRVPTRAVDVTPFENWTNKRHILSHLKIWGCPTNVKRIMSDKLKAKSDKCLFIGYPKETRGYQFYHTLGQKMFVSRNVVFLEKEFLLVKNSGSNVELEEVQDARIDADLLPDLELELVTHNNDVMATPTDTTS